MIRLALAFALLAFAPPARAGEVILVLLGLESGSGDVHVDVFAEAHAANFPYAEQGHQRLIQQSASTVRAHGATIALGELAPGRYALFAMHDANGNGDLDRNLFGLPTEGYGFSNGAKGLVSPPSFGDAAIRVSDGAPTRITIQLAH